MRRTGVCFLLILSAFAVCWVIFKSTMLNESTTTEIIGGVSYMSQASIANSSLVQSTTTITASTLNSSISPNETNIMEENPHAKRDFYIGLTLAMSSSIFIGTSFILKKKGLLKLAAQSSQRAGDGGFGYLKEPLWWGGMLLMAFGEVTNFVAYAFAPATLVTPLGALSVLVSAMLASKMLGENLNLIGKVGCLVCLLGSTVVVIHSPKETEIKSMAILAEKLKDPGFITYAFIIAVCACVLIFYYGPRHGQTNPLIYITISGSIGSLTVMGCKGLGVALKQTFAGDNQMTNWLTWLILITLVFDISIQMNYLNKALDIFNTAVVTPILYVVFTTFVIIASAILFKEWADLGALDIVGNICGFITTISGIFLLQFFKDLDITLKSTVKVRKDAPASVNTMANGEVRYTPTHDDSRSILLEHAECQMSDEEINVDHRYNSLMKT
ncbi:unnamed protein product [Owenia fusiformis]|uniref:Uncharacterized protein n=1 Tax=Owenia fusiformis TaxID=6347 RepID=A0A8J1TEG8_OWEFU|nr:unnamed protein product [Owenia fusiformis]